MSLPGSRNKTAGSLKHDPEVVTQIGLSSTDPKTIFSPSEIPGISVVWG